MNLAEYFENTKGTGVLSTASSSGEVNAAVYGRPRFVDESTITFIMRDRLSRSNLLENPNAAYLFLEEGTKSKGIRLYLTMIKEDDDPETVAAAKRGHDHGSSTDEKKYLVYFKIDSTRPILAGA
jgi:hypothetical protein